MHTRILTAGLCGLAFVVAGCQAGVSADGVQTPPPAPTTPTTPLPTDPEVPGLTDRFPRSDTPFEPGPVRLRRLLEPQYKNAVGALLGSASAAVALPPADVPLNGFNAVGAADLALSGNGVECYEASAAAIAAVASVDPASPARAICQSADAGCYASIVRTLGRRAFRRSLSEDEVNTYAALGVAAADAYVNLDASPFTKGLEYVLLGLLQSPHFLYIVEVGVEGEGDDARHLTGPELATRLAFFLTDAPPDDALLDAAEAGALSSPATLEATARELMTRPEARTALRENFRERLQLRDFSSLNRPEPGLTPSVRAAMVEESLRLIDDVVWDRNADIRELFSTTTTFVNDELAAYYGFDLPGSGAVFARVPTPPEQGRAGLLTRGAFLTREPAVRGGACPPQRRRDDAAGASRRRQSAPHHPRPHGRPHDRAPLCRLS